MKTGGASEGAKDLNRPTGSVSLQDRHNQADLVEQDPMYTVKGHNSLAIGIPSCAISSSKVLCPEVRRGGKKQKLGSRHSSIDLLHEEPLSEEEDSGDLAFLYSKPDDRMKGMQTDFVPGALDWKTLTLLAPPSYATSSASNTLTRELKTILKVQEKTPIWELGWFIDKNKTENLYQWIVELHSFENNLPLAQDMKKAEVSSIVLELRFGKEYPISPPFVRVIRPRFLPFMSGGGGHVTAGGAICMELLTK